MEFKSATLAKDIRNNVILKDIKLNGLYIDAVEVDEENESSVSYIYNVESECISDFKLLTEQK